MALGCNAEGITQLVIGARSAACLRREVPILPLDAVDGDVECAARLEPRTGSRSETAAQLDVVDQRAQRGS